MELQSLISYIKNHFSALYKVDDEKRGAHINYPDFGFIVSKGDFKSVEVFFISEWMEYYNNGTIDQELLKRSESIDYKFTSAGYSHANGGKSKWTQKKKDH